MRRNYTIHFFFSCYYLTLLIKMLYCAMRLIDKLFRVEVIESFLDCWLPLLFIWLSHFLLLRFAIYYYHVFLNLWIRDTHIWLSYESEIVFSCNYATYRWCILRILWELNVKFIRLFFANWNVFRESKEVQLTPTILLYMSWFIDLDYLLCKN